jgi:hypothetical protein
MTAPAAGEVSGDPLDPAPATGGPDGPADGATAGRRRGGWLALYFAGLTALCGWVFWPSIRTGFFEDDFGYLNATLPSGWWHSASYWDLAAQVLRPVTVISIGIQRELFGFHPIRFHLVALALLAVQGVLLFLVARRLGLARTGALAASTVLMLHTTNGWVLAWTASTSSTYAVIFGLSVIWFVAAPALGRRQLLAGSALFVVALLSREICMVLPAIGLVVRYFLGEGDWRPRARRAFRETAPLWGLLAVYLAIRVSFSAYASSKPEVPRLVPILNLTSFSETLPDVPIHARDLMTLASGPFHSVLDLSGFSFSPTILAVAAVFWVALVALVVREARAGRWIAVVGLAWFAIGIVPPLFLQPGITYGNYTDLALPGLAIAVGAVAQTVGASLPSRLRPVAAAACIAVLAVVAANGGNSLIRPVPPLIARAVQLEAQARREYPNPPRGSTIVIHDAIPEDVLWTSKGDLFRAMYDDPDLQVEFRPGPAG